MSNALRLSAVALAAALGVAVLSGGLAISDEKSPDGIPGMPPEINARITPGPQHAEMAWYLGDWDVEMKVTAPGTPPEMAQPTTGTCTYSWLIEGRWMMSRTKGTMMGMDIQWAHIHGYNNMTKVYETIGFDSLSTDAKVAYGNKVTQDGKTFGFQGMMNEWMNGQIHKPFRTVIRQLGDDRFELEIWDPEIGANGAQVMHWTYTRCK